MSSLLNKKQPPQPSSSTPAVPPQSHNSEPHVEEDEHHVYVNWSSSNASHLHQLRKQAAAASALASTSSSSSSSSSSLSASSALSASTTAETATSSGAATGAGPVTLSSPTLSLSSSLPSSSGFASPPQSVETDNDWPPWFHESMSRQEAENVLSNCGFDGVFLIRGSSTQGAYVLSLSHETRVFHYRIFKDTSSNNQFFIEGGETLKALRFDTLNALIQYFSVADTGLLCCSLRYPYEPGMFADDAQLHGASESTASSSVSSFAAAAAATSAAAPKQPAKEAPQTTSAAAALLSMPSSAASCSMAGTFLSRLSKEHADILKADPTFSGMLEKYFASFVCKDANAVKSGTNARHMRSLLYSVTDRFEKELALFTKRMLLLRKILAPEEGPLFSPAETLSSAASSGASGFAGGGGGGGAAAAAAAAAAAGAQAATSPVLAGGSSRPQTTAFVTDDDRVEDTTAFASTPSYGAFDTSGYADEYGNFGTLNSRLATCRQLISNVDKTIATVLHERTCEHTIRLDQTGDLQQLKVSQGIYAFSVTQVKAEGAMKSKATLQVDLLKGLFCVSKKSFDHNNVLQLIKSRSDKKRLGIKLFGSGRKDFVFPDAKTREQFCQLIQQMKNIHSNAAPRHTNKISVYLGTWNMGNARSPEDLSPWLFCNAPASSKHEYHDIVAIGTQEGVGSDKEWIATIKKHLRGDDVYEVVAICSLWQIRLVVLVLKKDFHRISHVQQSTVATGLANTLGNKGAVGVSFFYEGTSLCFVDAHLASGDENTARRNAQFYEIVKGMNLGQKELTGFDVCSQFHHLFWLGDLNYRLEMPVPQVLENIEKQNWGALLAVDQLNNSRYRGEAFFGFEEGPINFPPTYRFERGTRATYDWQKKARVNTPSWCDRILWRSFPNTLLEIVNYGCTNDITSSDHSPVFASFAIGLLTQYLPTSMTELPQHSYHIVFHQITAKFNSPVAPKRGSKFMVMFHGLCLDKSVPTRPNRLNAADKDRRMSFQTVAGGAAQVIPAPMWTRSDIPTIQPISSERGYLENQHLLLSVCSAEGDESFGECCISLMFLFGDNPIPFTCELVHRGENTGIITGEAHILPVKLATLLSEQDGTDAQQSSAVPVRVVGRHQAMSQQLPKLLQQGAGASSNSSSSESASAPKPRSESTLDIPEKVLQRRSWSGSESSLNLSSDTASSRNESAAAAHGGGATDIVVGSSVYAVPASSRQRTAAESSAASKPFAETAQASTSQGVSPAAGVIFSSNHKYENISALWAKPAATHEGAGADSETIYGNIPARSSMASSPAGLAAESKASAGPPVGDALVYATVPVRTKTATSPTPPAASSTVSSAAPALKQSKSGSGRSFFPRKVADPQMLETYAKDIEQLRELVGSQLTRQAAFDALEAHNFNIERAGEWLVEQSVVNNTPDASEASQSVKQVKPTPPKPLPYSSYTQQKPAGAESQPGGSSAAAREPLMPSVVSDDEKSAEREPERESSSSDVPPSGSSAADTASKPTPMPRPKPKPRSVAKPSETPASAASQEATAAAGNDTAQPPSLSVASPTELPTSESATSEATLPTPEAPSSQCSSPAPSPPTSAALVVRKTSSGGAKPKPPKPSRSSVLPSAALLASVQPFPEAPAVSSTSLSQSPDTVPEQGQEPQRAQPAGDSSSSSSSSSTKLVLQDTALDANFSWDDSIDAALQRSLSDATALAVKHMVKDEPSLRSLHEQQHRHISALLKPFKPPVSLHDYLARLSMLKHKETFVTHGFDDIKLLKFLNEEDLDDMHILEPSERQTLLHELMVWRESFC